MDSRFDLYNPLSYALADSPTCCPQVGPFPFGAQPFS